MRLTPIRCDVCGRLVYLEEDSVFLLVVQGMSEWCEDERIELELCRTCYDKIMDSIDRIEDEASRECEAVDIEGKVKVMSDRLDRLETIVRNILEERK